VAKYKDAKDVWEALRVRYLGGERVQKARLQTLRTELDKLNMKENETIDDFAGKFSGIATNFKSPRSRIENELLVRKLLNFAPKKCRQIVASIEQYSDIDTMSFEQAVGRLKAYEKRLKLDDEEENDQGKLLLSNKDWKERTKFGFVTIYNSLKNDLYKGPFFSARTRHLNFQTDSGYGRGRGGRFQTNEDRRDQGSYRNKRNIKCYNCQEYGHYAAECSKKESKE